MTFPLLPNFAAASLIAASLVAASPIAAPLAAAAPSRAERGPILEALFHVENDGFTPPADNKPLQALLAKKPALTFFEACGVGDTAEMTRQLRRDPRLATAWSEF